MADKLDVSRLTVLVRYHDGIPVIEAHGECDLITSRKLRETSESLINTGHNLLVFDMRDMGYIDSSGFRVLLEAKNKVSERGGDIILVSLTVPVERVFRLLHLDELVKRTDTVEEAVHLLESKQMDCLRDAKPETQD